MARLVGSGGELNTKTSDVEFAVGVGTELTLDTSVVRSGTYSYKWTDAASARTVFHQFKASNTDNVFFYVRFYFRKANNPSVNTRIVLFSNTVGTNVLPLKVTTTGTLQLFSNTTQIGSDSSSLSNDTWYRIEISGKRNTASAAMETEAKIDGVTFASSTTATGSVQGLARFYFSPFDASTFTYYIDDIAINDDSGSFQNSWPGAGEIIHLRPDAAGDAANWSRGGADSGANWSQVEEVTPEDGGGGASEVTDNVTDEIDMYNLDATPVALASDDTINLVSVGVRYNGTGASANSSFVLRIEASSGGTVEESAAITPANSTWVTNANSAPRNYPLTLYDLPGGSTTAWTKSDLDTAQIGAKISTGDTNNAQITTIWLLVDHKPAEAAVGGGNDWPGFQSRGFWSWRF